MSLVLVTPPSVEPLTAAEARARLNIGSEVTDAVLNAFISAARLMIDGADGWLGRALVTQTWDLVLDHFEGWNLPRERGFYGGSYAYGGGASSDYGYDPQRLRQYRHGIIIPLPPLQSVTSVKYIDTDGSEQTLDPVTYVVEKGTPSHIVLATGKTWPAVSTQPGSVVIRFVAGYGSLGSDVPENVRSAICLQASHLRSLSAQNLFLNHEEIPGVLNRGWTVGANAGVAIADAAMALLNPLRVWT